MKLQLDNTKIYAIALEGGGAKGAYQIGVWKALDEAGIKFNAVSGTSVGALNGALMCMGDLEKAIALWCDIRLSDIINMDEEANAVFIIVPDERFTRHRFVTLFITQMYKELVEKANLNLRRKEEGIDTAILKRNTYFVLDVYTEKRILSNEFTINSQS